MVGLRGVPGPVIHQAVGVLSACDAPSQSVNIRRNPAPSTAVFSDPPSSVDLNSRRNPCVSGSLVLA